MILLNQTEILPFLRQVEQNLVDNLRQFQYILDRFVFSSLPVEMASRLERAACGASLPCFISPSPPQENRSRFLLHLPGLISSAFSGALRSFSYRTTRPGGLVSPNGPFFKWLKSVRCDEGSSLMEFRRRFALLQSRPPRGFTKGCPPSLEGIGRGVRVRERKGSNAKRRKVA